MRFTLFGLAAIVKGICQEFSNVIDVKRKRHSCPQILSFVLIPPHQVSLNARAKGRLLQLHLSLFASWAREQRMFELNSASLG